MSVGLLRVFYFSAIRCEREYEMKRLNNLKCQENEVKKIQFSLRERPIGLRRPLPPKWLSSHCWICSLWFLHPKRMKDSDLSLCAVGCIHLNAPWWMNQLLWVIGQLLADRQLWKICVPATYLYRCITGNSSVSRWKCCWHWITCAIHFDFCKIAPR